MGRNDERTGSQKDFQIRFSTKQVRFKNLSKPLFGSDGPDYPGFVLSKLKKIEASRS